MSYKREVDQDSVEKQTEKRETWFSLEWHFENGTGNRVDVKPDVARRGYTKS